MSLLMLTIAALLGVYAVPFLAPSVQASHNGDDWAPLGPYMDKVLVNIFGENEPALFLALRNGQLDLTDWNVPPSDIPSTCSDPLLHCELNSELGMWGFDFNHHPENKWFGAIQGSDEKAVTEIIRAIAHLADKDEHISTAIQGLASRLDGPLPGFADLWGQPFDDLHTGSQTIKSQSNDPGLTNAIRITVGDAASVPKPNAFVYLIHLSVSDSAGEVLGSYAGLCVDGFKCATVSSMEKHPGPDGILGTRDDEFNPIYQVYNDPVKDGIVTFQSNTDTKTNTKIPMPNTGVYIVYAVNKDDNTAGWGYLDPSLYDTATVNNILSVDPGGWYNKTPYPSAGYEEFCQARDHLVRIRTDINNDGIPDQPFKDDDNNCRIDLDSAIYSAPAFRSLQLMTRFGLFRQELGDRLADRLTTLFGTGAIVGNEHHTRAEVTPIVFTGIPFDDWDVYTMGWGLSRDFDYIDDLYSKQFAFPPCGIGDPVIQQGSQNYGSFCNQLFSSAAKASKNTFDPIMAKLATFLHQFALGSDPVWANAGYFAQNNAWTGYNNIVGFGTEFGGTGPYGSIMNMYPKKDCSLSSRLLFQDLNANGCWDFGEPLTMRWSFFSDTQHLNIFWSNWKWDLQVTSLIYDSLQSYNPYQLQEDYATMASSWTNFPSPTAAQLGYAPAAGTALTQRWFIKNHLGWSDGKALTALDVAFSMLAYKEGQSPVFLGTVLPITYVRMVSNAPQQNVVDVGLDTDAPQFRAGHLAGGLPILPCNVYSTGLNSLGVVDSLPNCGGITTGVTYPALVGGPATGPYSGVDRRANFDPTLVPDEDGDGVPESNCNDLGTHRTGHKGTGPFILECTSNGTASPGLGGTFVFRPHLVTKATFAKSKEYWSSPHNYLVWRWADFNNNGIVGTDDKARTRLNPPLGCRNKAVPTDQNLWDANHDGVPDDNCIQFDFNRNGVSSDFSDRARMTLEGGKQWTYPCVWSSGPPPTGWPGPKTCAGAVIGGYRTVIYPWTGWVWWLGHQCNGPDHIKGTADDDKNACWFTKFSSRPP